MHHMMKLTLGNKLLLAPIESKYSKILTIGTEVGIWAIEMAERYPDADIIGIALSSSRP